ncbi:unnamed protein product, partial [Didymodactylos carnosus]
FHLLESVRRTTDEDVKDFIYRVSEEHDEYKFQKYISRNIVTLGRTRSGKTTMANVIQNVAYVPPEVQLCSDTRRSVEVRSLILSSMHSMYNINIIDTPGFYQRVRELVMPLTNDATKT